MFVEFWRLNWKVISELSLFRSCFTDAVHYCTYSDSASLPLPVMDRCKSSQSCSDSPISPNLICVKNSVLTLTWVSSPLLSSHLLYSTFPPPLPQIQRTILLLIHTLFLSPLSFAALHSLFSFPPCLSLSPCLPPSLPPVSHLKALSYLLEWKSSFTICLIKCVFNLKGDIFLNTSFFRSTSAQFHLIWNLAQVPARAREAVLESRMSRCT